MYYLKRFIAAAIVASIVLVAILACYVFGWFGLWYYGNGLTMAAWLYGVLLLFPVSMYVFN